MSSSGDEDLHVPLSASCSEDEFSGFERDDLTPHIGANVEVVTEPQDKPVPIPKKTKRKEFRVKIHKTSKPKKPVSSVTTCSFTSTAFHGILSPTLVI